ncbi:GDSL-type esterase/lipase family protein [Sphingobacterium sp. UBA7038]|uniref:GDSL-type esterase/lipase family protein n=1 Tax=Sphingobacterium sp. UBA7038 TaxID=1947515 RepID=UPI00257C6CF1|nr:GDSL-type esterase/lipase family protein [Sphingobacterium sp. UBA7038]
MCRVYNVLKALLLVVKIIPIVGFSQQVDSLRTPEIFSSQIAMFNGMPMDTESVVFLGNSITFWGNWTERLQNMTVKNRGIAGDNTYGVLERLDGILVHKPKLIFLMIGVNDLAQGFPDELIVHNINKIVDRIQQQSPTTELVLQSLLPVNPTMGKLSSHTQHAGRIPGLNCMLKGIAKTKGAHYLDLYSQFVDSDGYLRKNLTWDGVHLTEEGYKIWVKMLKCTYFF